MSLATDRHDVVVDIGGTAILLRTHSEAFRTLLQDRYQHFLREPMSRQSARDPLALDVELLPESGPVTPHEELVVRHDGDRWQIVRGDFRAHWDAVRGHGTITQTLSPFAIDSVLRVVHSLIQAPRGGFLLHGASAIRNGRAFLFSGVSGAGKTTISRLAPPDATILTDEISYIRRLEASDGAQNETSQRHGRPVYEAFGTPFAGELARIGANGRAPIAHLFFLTQGPENRIDPIPTSDALRMLLRNILFFADDSKLVEMVFRSACEFVDHVPTSRLTFLPDQRVWELIQ